MVMPILPVTLVGSYPQPDSLIDKKRLMAAGPPRVRLTEVWRHSGQALQDAQDEAVRAAVLDMETAGLDIVTDGEIRRESYFNQFANALDGIDLANPGEVLSRLGRPTLVPRVIGPIKRSRPIFRRDVEFLRAQTNKTIKVTIPGPFTMTRLVQDDHYHDEDEMIAAYADAVNAELRDLKAAGADILQLDEPYLQSNAEEAAHNGVSAINRAFDGIDGPKAVHLCFGYSYVVKDKPTAYSFLPELESCLADQVSIEAAQPGLDPAILKELPNKTVIYGVLNMDDNEIETPDQVAARLRAALEFVPAERLIAASDCGMKYMSRDVAFAKLQAMAQGTQIVRAELNLA